jgi:hypothetical protein
MKSSRLIMPSIYESLAQERGFNISEAAKELIDSQDIYLVSRNNAKSAVLYDREAEAVIGYVCFMKIANGSYQVKYAVAEDGYGPTVYDFGLMAMYPTKIAPSRWSVSDDANAVWKYYYEKRSDVLKYDMKPDDLNYKEEYTEKWLNCYYQMKPTAKFNTIFKRGEEDPALSDAALYKQGKEYFNSVYTDWG